MTVALGDPGTVIVCDDHFPLPSGALQISINLQSIPSERPNQLGIDVDQDVTAHLLASGPLL